MALVEERTAVRRTAGAWTSVPVSNQCRNQAPTLSERASLADTATRRLASTITGTR